MRISLSVLKKIVPVTLMITLVTGCTGYDESTHRSEVEALLEAEISDEGWQDRRNAGERRCEEDFLIEDTIAYAVERGEEKLLRYEEIMVRHQCPKMLPLVEEALDEVK